ncbi:MAG: NAD(P)-dependent oxidoreductase [Candidatus Omnitrophica bacterium]|nr:NAD(P)-dependent oxidoreductase [Candidatus Omnitrophota bacterium]
MKILVTGATGFIGKRFVEKLIEGGVSPVCLARKTSKTEHLLKAGLKVVYSEISDLKGLSAIFSSERPEIVVHSAARVSDRDKADIISSNIAGTRNICEASLKYDVKRLVYISSIAVVCGHNNVELTDEMEYKAHNLYGETKLEAEKIAVEYREKGLPAAILRPCMVYGPGEPHALDKIFGFIRKRLIPIPGLRDVTDKLQLVHIDNLVHAMFLAMEKEEALTGTFTIADKEIITIREFVKIASEELAVPGPVVIPGWMFKIAFIIPAVKIKYDRIFKNRTFDTSRAVNVLGYSPSVSTVEGLRKTARSWALKFNK